jgi:hypothetical protein
MDWRRIAIFSILLFVSIAVSVAIFTILINRLEYSLSSVQATVGLNFIIPSFVSFLVFLTLAFKQVERSYIHACVVYAFAIVISGLINLVAFQQLIFSSIWFLTYPLQFIAAMIATFVGIKLRGRQG